MIEFRDFTPAKIDGGRARITREGYLVADALVGRANNVQEYAAASLGDAFADLPPNSIVRVFRPESEVFAVDSIKSASRLPITLDHPAGTMVDAKNWREFAKGETGEEILRDGDFIRVPIRVTDAAAVDSVRTDRPEFSLGYTAEIRRVAGVHDGQAYDATVANIRYNHLAACRDARGGPELRITDERPQNGAKTMTPKIVLVDSAPVDVSNPDTAATVVGNLIDARDTALAALADSGNLVATRDAEIATLRDQLAAAKPTPAQLRDAAADYVRVRDAAKAMGATVTDEMDADALRAAAVSHKIGDAAKGYSAEQIVAAFDVLAKVGDATGSDPLRDSFRKDGPPVNIADDRKAFNDARAARFARFETAHKAA